MAAGQVVDGIPSKSVLGHWSYCMLLKCVHNGGQVMSEEQCMRALKRVDEMKETIKDPTELDDKYRSSPGTVLTGCAPRYAAPCVLCTTIGIT